jgi:hypothetical protein
VSTHEELMQLRIQRTRKLGEQPMTIKELEDLLESTRKKLADQGYIVDDRLLSKERMLEQAVIDAYLDSWFIEPTKEQS